MGGLGPGGGILGDFGWRSRLFVVVLLYDEWSGSFAFVIRCHFLRYWLFSASACLNVEKGNRALLGA